MSARVLTIGMDIDGVLADFVPQFAALATQMTGKKVGTVATCWDWYKADWGITVEEEKAIWGHITDNPSFWGGLGPMPEGFEGIEKLNTLRMDHRIYYITTRPATAKYFTELWLQRMGAETPTVILTSQKGKVCQGLGVDIFVDDKPENCLEVYRSLPMEAQVFLYEQPWSEALRKTWAAEGGQGGIKVAKSLREVWDAVGIGDDGSVGRRVFQSGIGA